MSESFDPIPSQTLEQLRQVARREAVFDCSLIVSADHRILQASPGVWDVFGYHVGEVEGENLNIILPRHMQAAHPRLIDDFLKSGLRLSKIRKPQNAVGAGGRLVPIVVILERVEIDCPEFTGPAVRARMLKQNYADLIALCQDANQMPAQLDAASYERQADALDHLAKGMGNLMGLDGAKFWRIVVLVFGAMIIAGGFYLGVLALKQPDCAAVCAEERRDRDSWQSFRGQTMNQGNRPLPEREERDGDYRAREE